MKKQKFVLVVGEANSTLVHFAEGRVRQVWRLEAPCNLVDVLHNHHGVAMDILINTLDQAVHHESVAGLNAFKRRQFMRRCLDLKYNNAEFVAVDDRGAASATVAAIQRSGALQEWLDALTSTSNVVDGVYSLPVESFGLIDENNCQAQTDWQIVVTRHGENGLRHAIFHKQQLSFMRLAPAIYENRSSVETADAIASSITATIAYTRRLPDGGNGAITVHVADTHDTFRHLPGQIVGAEAVLPIDVLSKIGAQLPNTKAVGDVVHAIAFANKGVPAARFMPKRFVRRNWMIKAPRYLQHFTVVCLLLSVGAGTFLAVRNHGLNSGIRALENTTRTSSAGSDPISLLRLLASKLNQRVRPIKFIWENSGEENLVLYFPADNDKSVQIDGYQVQDLGPGVVGIRRANG